MKHFRVAATTFALLGALGLPAMGSNQMTLFFFHRELGLIPFTRTVTGQANARTVVEQLLRGPNPKTGMPNPFPRGTRLIDVQVKSATAYVNLSSEFVTNYDPNKGDPLWLNEIEFSLLQLPEIDSVILMVDGQVLDEYRDISLSWPVSRNKLLGINSVGTLTYSDWKLNMYFPVRIGQVNVLVPKTQRLTSLVRFFEAFLQDVGLQSVRVEEISLTEDRLVMQLNREAETLFRGSSNSQIVTSLLYTASEIPGVATLEVFTGRKRVGRWRVPDNPPGIIVVPDGLNEEAVF